MEETFADRMADSDIQLPSFPKFMVGMLSGKELPVWIKDCTEQGVVSFSMPREGLAVMDFWIKDDSSFIDWAGEQIVRAHMEKFSILMEDAARFERQRKAFQHKHFVVYDDGETVDFRFHISLLHTIANEPPDDADLAEKDMDSDEWIYDYLGDGEPEPVGGVPGCLFQTMARWVEQRHLNSDAVDAKRGQFRQRLRGTHGCYRCTMRVDEETGIVICRWLYDQKVPDARRAAVAEFLIRANAGHRFGFFVMDPIFGEVAYRTGLNVKGDRLTFFQLSWLFGAGGFMVDRHCPGFMDVVNECASPAEALEKVVAKAAAIASGC